MKARARKVLGAVLGFTLAATAAYALWTVVVSDTTQPGKVNVGTITAPTFNAVSNGSITDSLLPGETKGLTFNITNPNSSALKLTDLVGGSGSGADISVTGGIGACSGTNFSFNPYHSATGVSVPSGSNQIVTVPGTVSLSASAPTGCQGAVVSVVNLNATFGL